MNFWDLLTSAKIQGFIEEAFSKRLDALQVSTYLNKEGFSNEERAAIMDYMALVPKFREKFFGDAKQKNAFLLCDKLALEQSTAKDIGRWKANLWPSEGSVNDLCCGMGGDSLFLPETLKVTGFDLDENRLAMYRYNMQALGKSVGTQCCDVRSVENGADYFTIDPARRAIEGENQRDLRNLTPTLEEVIEISKHYKGGMAKLPPGYPPAEIPDGTEIIYIGGHSDCRECLVEWSRKRDRSSETLDDDLQEKLDKNDSLEGKDRTYRTATSKSDLPLGEISQYISEPAPVLIRSHLFNQAVLACDPSAHLISEGIAYVASATPLPTPGFACYEVLDHTEIATGAVRAMLKEHNIGKITLKLRGVKLDPDAEIKRLKPKGKESAILFYTRAYGEKVAILARKVNVH